jgi:hypothetical protein
MLGESRKTLKKMRLSCNDVRVRAARFPEEPVKRLAKDRGFIG